MLQALNRKGELITPSLYSIEELEALRHDQYVCPSCKAPVILRASPRVLPHFAHYAKTGCRLHLHESEGHKRSKLLLYQWLKRQYPGQVYLEYYLSEIKQRPDLFIARSDSMKRSVAIEFQRSSIQTDEVFNRIKGYEQLNIFPVWIASSDTLSRIRKSKPIYKIPSFHKPFILQSHPSHPAFILYFCPKRKQFSVLSDLYFSRQTSAYAIKQVLPLNRIRLRSLFQVKAFRASQVFRYWYDEKRRFRLSPAPAGGKEFVFRQWLYQQGYHIEQLPALIHLPVRSQYKMLTPLWHWQSKLVLELIGKLKPGHRFSKSHCLHVIKEQIEPRYRKQADELIDQYMFYFEKSKRIRRLNEREWVKLRELSFYRYIEESLRADRALLEFFMTEVEADPLPLRSKMLE